MRHLLSYSVYQDPGVFGPGGAMLERERCDGLEVLTAFGPPDEAFRPLATTVHLPYATDWLAAWEGRPYDMDAEMSRFVMYGRDRESVVRNLSDAIASAAELSPLSGVLHAGNADLPEIWHRRSGRSCRQVLSSFSDMINQVVGEMPGGEPPFRILFENLWWPGLRLLDDSDFRYLSDRIEFRDWGICLDTGHLMNCIPGLRTQSEGISALEEIFRDYSPELIGRIDEVHFHWSASGDYREGFEEREMGDPAEFYTQAYPHVSHIDQHNPFTDRSCTSLLEILRPDRVVHELPGTDEDPFSRFRVQRALFERSDPAGPDPPSSGPGHRLGVLLDVGGIS